MPTTDTIPPPPSAPPSTQRSTSQPAAAKAPGFSQPSKDCGGFGVVINAVEGFGKTTIGAFAEGSAIIMAKGETGYRTLYANDLAPERPQVVVDNWSELLSQVGTVAESPGDIRVLVLDALGGFERMCHQHVCDAEFGGDWGDRGFLSYHKGFEMSVGEWLKLLNRLDDVRAKGVHVLLLSHCKVRPFKNPLGTDYDRYVADCHEKTWGVTHKWADAVLFGNFHTPVQTETANAKKGKAIGGKQRIIYTEHCAGYDAKNRLGMPPDGITMPNEAKDMWSVLKPYIIKNGGPNV